MGRCIPRAYAIKYVQYGNPPLVLMIYLPDMYAESLQLTSGVIWTALNIDYPGHSFSHLGIFWGEYIRTTQMCPC